MPADVCRSQDGREMLQRAARLAAAVLCPAARAAHEHRSQCTPDATDGTSDTTTAAPAKAVSHSPRPRARSASSESIAVPRTLGAGDVRVDEARGATSIRGGGMHDKTACMPASLSIRGLFRRLMRRG